MAGQRQAGPWPRAGSIVLAGLGDTQSPGFSRTFSVSLTPPPVSGPLDKLGGRSRHGRPSLQIGGVLRELISTGEREWREWIASNRLLSPIDAHSLADHPQVLT